MNYDVEEQLFLLPWASDGLLHLSRKLRLEIARHIQSEQGKHAPLQRKLDEKDNTIKQLCRQIDDLDVKIDALKEFSRLANAKYSSYPPVSAFIKLHDELDKKYDTDMIRDVFDSIYQLLESVKK